MQLFDEFPWYIPGALEIVEGVSSPPLAHTKIFMGSALDNMALSASDPLRSAAESFVTRLRRGERPTFAEYTERFPDQATRIRELFPKLLAIERRASHDQATGPFGPI